MAKLLILFRLVPFRSISYRRLEPGFHPHPNLLPSREKGPDRLRGNDGCEQCSNRRGHGVMGSCRWFGSMLEVA